MKKDQALALKPGDEVRILPLWDQTSTPAERVLSPTEVVEVRAENGCQSGAIITVKSSAGHLLRLDAGWFKG